MGPKPSLGGEQLAGQQIARHQLQADHFLHQVGALQQHQTLLPAALGGMELAQALHQRVAPACDQLGGALPIQGHLEGVVTAHVHAVLHHQVLAL